MPCLMYHNVCTHSCDGRVNYSEDWVVKRLSGEMSARSHVTRRASHVTRRAARNPVLSESASYDGRDGPLVHASEITRRYEYRGAIRPAVRETVPRFDQMFRVLLNRGDVPRFNHVEKTKLQIFFWCRPIEFAKIFRGIFGSTLWSFSINNCLAMTDNRDRCSWQIIDNDPVCAFFCQRARCNFRLGCAANFIRALCPA